MSLGGARSEGRGRVTGVWLRRHGTSFGLCLLALVLAVVVLVDRARSGPGAADAARGKDRLFAVWREADVTRVRIQHGDSTLELAREPGATATEARWRLRSEGRELDTDVQAVGQLLATLELARSERRVDAEGIEPPALGLDHPELTIELAMGDSARAVRVGAVAPSPTDSRYAEIQGAPEGRAVVVLSKELCAALESAADALRSRKIFPFPLAQADSVVLRGEDGAVRWTLRRGGIAGRGAAGFRLGASSPVGDVRADWRAVEALLGALSELEVESFVPAAVAAASESGARLTLEVNGKDVDASSVRLEARGPCPGSPGILLVRIDPRPVAVCVSERAIAAWDVSAERLADRHVVGAPESSVIELKLAADRRRLEVARRDDGWHMRAPRDEQAETESVNRLLSGILALRGTFVPPEQAADRKALGLTEPETRLRVVSLGDPTLGPSEERIEQIEIGTAQDGVVHMRRLEDDVVLSLPAAEAELLQLHATSLRSTGLVDVLSSRVRSLRIVAGTLRQELGRAPDESSWTLREPTGPGLAADPTLAASLADGLARLRAARWVADGPQPAFKLAEPWCTIEATLSPGTTQPAAGDTAPHDPGADARTKIRVVLGSPTEGGYFAQLDDDPAVFVVPKGLAELASHWLLDRAALMVDPKAIVRVSLAPAPGTERLVIEQRDDGWQVVGRGPSSADTATRVRDALADMMAEGVVHLGPPRLEEQLGRPRLHIDVELREADGKPTHLGLDVGAGDVWQGTAVVYVRREGLDATYAVAQARLRPLLELF